MLDREDDVQSFPVASGAGDADDLIIGYYGGPPDARDYVYIFLPMAFALLSVFAGYAVIRECFVDLSENFRKKAIPIQIIGVALGFTFHSFMTMMGPIPAPAQVNFVLSFGSQVTCDVQGFFTTFGAFSGSCLDVGLVWLYHGIVLHNWQEERLMKYVPRLMVCSWTAAFVAGVIPIPLAMYNYNSSTCWLAPFPKDCSADESNCIRGEKAWAMRAFYFAFPYWPLLALAAFLFYRMRRAVRRLEERVSRYTGNWVTSQAFSVDHQSVDDSADDCNANTTESATVRDVNRSKSRAVASQFYRYTGAFMFMLSYATVEVIVALISGSAPYAMDLGSDLLMASQATIIFFAFAAPRTTMKTPEGKLLRKILLGWLGGGVMCILAVVIKASKQMARYMNWISATETQDEESALSVSIHFQKESQSNPSSRKIDASHPSRIMGSLLSMNDSSYKRTLVVSQSRVESDASRDRESDFYPKGSGVEELSTAVHSRSIRYTPSSTNQDAELPVPKAKSLLQMNCRSLSSRAAELSRQTKSDHGIQCRISRKTSALDEVSIALASRNTSCNPTARVPQLTAHSVEQSVDREVRHFTATSDSSIEIVFCNESNAGLQGCAESGQGSKHSSNETSLALHESESSSLGIARFPLDVILDIETNMQSGSRMCEPSDSTVLPEVGLLHNERSQSSQGSERIDD